MDAERHMTSQVLQDYLGIWIEAFITAKRAGGMTKNTILYYINKLKQFNTYCEAQQLNRVEQLTPTFLREYLLYLEATNHNARGLHGKIQTKQ